MTIAELIEKLSTVEDKNKKVIVSNLGTGVISKIDNVEVEDYLTEVIINI